MKEEAAMGEMLTMPNLFADDCTPHLRHAVHRLERLGLDEKTVLFRLEEPVRSSYKEIWKQAPAPGTEINSRPEVFVSPSAVPYATCKEEWYKDQAEKEKNLTKGEFQKYCEGVSDGLWMLGKLEWIFDSPSRILHALVDNLAVREDSILGLEIADYKRFTPQERRAISDCLFLKPNSRFPRVFSGILQKILGVPFEITSVRYDLFPHRIELLIGIARGNAAPDFIDKIALLERMFLPVSHETVYLFLCPYAVLDDDLAVLDSIQLC